MSILYNKYLFWTAKFAVGFVFIFAGIEKIAEPLVFSDSIANYKLLPFAVVNVFAVAIPWIEVVSGILLIFNKYIKENAFIFNFLITLFTLMVFIAFVRGLDINCGCFGTADAQKVGLQKIIENIGLLILGFYVYFFADNSEYDNNQPNR